MAEISTICTGLQKTADDVEAAFGNLSVEQLNWKPSAKRWSVAQCLDHLITTHGLFLPVLARFDNGKLRPTFWERVSPFSGFFGRFLIKGLDPANPKKMKTTSRGQPSASEIDSGVVDKYREHQRQLVDHIRRLPAGLDLKKTMVTSPMLAFFTYSLDDWLTIAVIHGERHILQARRVTETEGFPRS